MLLYSYEFRVWVLIFFIFSRVYQPYHKILRVQATTNPPWDIELDRDVNRKKISELLALDVHSNKVNTFLSF